MQPNELEHSRVYVIILTLVFILGGVQAVGKPNTTESPAPTSVLAAAGKFSQWLGLDKQ
jgi:hypothetical protein